MKVRFVVIICMLIFYSNNFYAQEYFFEGEYTYSFNGDLVYGASEISFVNKFFNGVDSVYLFSRERRLQFFDSNDVESSVLDTISIFGSSPDSILISYTNDGIRHLLYNFNLDIGSIYTIYPDNLAYPGSDSIHVTVSGYGDTVVSGQLFYFQSVVYNFDTSPFTIEDKIFKGVGSLNYYMEIFDIFSNQLGGGFGGPLVCYRFNNFSYINESLHDSHINDISDDCIVINSIDDVDDSYIVIYPNPSTDLVNVYSKSINIDNNIIAYSINGNVYTLQVSTRNTNLCTINTVKLPPGLYCLLINRKLFSFIKI